MTQVVQWANMSISTVERVPAENRNDECDQAKCAALYNLGELAEQRKDMDEATLQYQRARQVANSVGWGEGVEMANQGIKRTQKALAN